VRAIGQRRSSTAPDFRTVTTGEIADREAVGRVRRVGVDVEAAVSPTWHWTPAGEVGHLIVNPHDGPRCGCGAYGYLETMASRTALAWAAVNPRGPLATLSKDADKAAGRRWPMRRGGATR
jgi:ROK family